LEHEDAADAAGARSSAAAAPGHQAVYQAGEKTKPTEVEADGRRERLGSPESERVAGAFAFSAFLPASSDLWASVGVAWRRRPMPAPALGSESSEGSEGSEGSDGGEELDVAALEAAALQASGGGDDAAQAVAQAEAHERRRLAKQHKAAVRAAARAAAAGAAAEAEEVLATVDPERWTLVRLAQTSGNADAADEDTRFGDDDDDDDDTGVGPEAGAGAGVLHGVPHGVAHEVPPLPVWLGHGEADGVVPHAWGLATATALSLARRQRPKSGSSSSSSSSSSGSNGGTDSGGAPRFAVTFGSFPLAEHELCAPAVAAFAEWAVHTLNHLPPRGAPLALPSPDDAAPAAAAAASAGTVGVAGVARRGPADVLADDAAARAGARSASSAPAAPPAARSADDGSAASGPPTGLLLSPLRLPSAAAARDADVKAAAAAAAARAAVAHSPALGSAAGSVLADPFALPYRVATAALRPPHWHTATFRAPPGWASALCRHPVQARGASFALQRADEPGSGSGGGSGGGEGASDVTCTYYSTAPDATAAELV
jgi:hypothetical protein